MELDEAMKEILREGKKKKDKHGLPKPVIGGERFKGVSIGEDEDGFYVYTHRARSKSYPSKEKIPDYVIKKIESTG